MAWPPAATKVRARSGVAAVEVGVVGEGRHRQVLGHVDQRHVGCLVHRHHRGRLQRAPGADHVEVAQAGQEIGGGGDEPALGDGHADEQHRAVGRRRLQLDDGVPGGVGRRRQRVLRTGQRGQRPVGRGVLRGGLEGMLRRGGEQHDDPGDHRHDGAHAHQHHDGAPVVVVRRGVEQGRDVRGGPGPATSLGWRHSRSSGSIQPRRGASGSSGLLPPPSPGPGVPSSGSSGVSLTWATIPRKSRKVPSADRPAVP